MPYNSIQNEVNNHIGAEKVICSCCGTEISEEKGTPYYKIGGVNYCEVCICDFKRRT